MKKWVALIFVYGLIIIMILAGCSGGNEIRNNTTEENTQQVQKSPQIRGIITTLSNPDDNITGLLVEGVIESDTLYDKAYIKVTDDTTIFLRENNEYTEMKRSDLKIGQTIEAFFIGPIATSYPVQATAGEILIIDGYIDK